MTTYDTFKESAQYLTKANIGMLDVGEGQEALTVSENSRAMPWDVVILDEASKALKVDGWIGHRLTQTHGRSACVYVYVLGVQNPGTQRSKAINTICRASPDEKTQFRLLLTGGVGMGPGLGGGADLSLSLCLCLSLPLSLSSVCGQARQLRTT